MQSTGIAKPVTVHEAVLHELRKWLFSGRLTPGQPLRQEAIAEELGVSVVPVREALKTLETEGQVTYRPRRGFSVTYLGMDELIELCDIRCNLESLAVTRGLPNLTEEDLATMDRLLDEMAASAESGRMIELGRLDRRFHFLVFERAGMPQLLRLITQLWDKSDPYRAMFFSDDNLRRYDRKAHDEILAATRRRDAVELCALLDEHRRSALNKLGHLLQKPGN
ncbi:MULTISPECIES: GntR family transcriptional regulator [unclassified Streptomyces]|uniref:GntR family transcriptional regulator n=1 Tax=unclassified Streptomyces TaxID=2593676 RepID=UPI0022374405|nr:GntR family transcriptional regulator [Streptomyces sp. SHP 1-2]MCW5254139.1 GntR family transcriptional regulator [Streptomyces sp. SHP 1-2]